jgi:NAD(P)-dependent dehydrogenase (short-subunit alcohol dehydrogenase family)
MKEFRDKIAVVTGGGTGMGRELVVQLAREGCHVAMCDVSEENMAETQALAEAAAPEGTRVSAHPCDVSNEQQVIAFRDAVVAGHDTDHVNLVFNNAGIAGGGTFTSDETREEWERTFGVCWFGVYYCSRAFMPLLVASDEAHLINTSSVNGFWASVGPFTPHTAYSAAKFAVKGFSEALITDLRLNAPHVKVSVVMPGHIGTSIAINTGKAHGNDPMDMSAEEVARTRERLVAMGLPVGNESDDQIRAAIKQQLQDFRDNAPMTAAQASNVILDGVRNERWRILVGDDAQTLDRRVRANPEEAYEPSFLTSLQEDGHLGGATDT